MKKYLGSLLFASALSLGVADAAVFGTSDLDSLMTVQGTHVGVSGPLTQAQMVTWLAGAGGGTVTSVTAGTGLSGGAITTTGTISLDLTHANTWTGVQTMPSLIFSGSAPVPTGTGSPSIASGSTDTSGEVTAGSSATSVIITFAVAKTNAPFCVVGSQTQLAAFSYTISTTAITITQTATSGNKIDYVCAQH